MSTYTDLHTRKRENLTILRQPDSPIDGLTPQRVIFSNPNNIYNGLFKGQLNVTSAILSNSILNDCEINGGLINDATTIYSDGRKIFLADLYDMIDSLSDQLSDIWKNIRGGLNYTGNLSVDVDFSTFTNLLRYNYYPEQPPEKYREGFFYVVQTPQRGSHYIVEGLEVEHGDWVIFNKNVEFQNLTSADVEIFDAQDFDNFRLSSDNYAKGNNTFEGNTHFIGNVDISGSVAISNDLAVNGTTKLEDVEFGGEASFGGNAVISGDLTVAGDSTLSTIIVNGQTTLNDDTNIAKDLSVAGNTTIVGNVNISANATINDVKVLQNLSVDGNAYISTATLSNSTLLTARVENLSIDIGAVQYTNSDNSVCSLQDLSINLQQQLTSAQLSVNSMSSMLTSILSNEMRYFGTLSCGYSTSNVDLSTFLYANIKDNAYQFHKGYQYRISSDISGTNSAITINDGHHQKVLFSNDYIIFNQYVALSDATWSHIDIIRDAQAECEQLSGRVDKLSAEVNTISTNLLNAISANLDKISALSDSLSQTSAYLSSQLSNNCQVVSALCNAASATANVGDIAIVSAYISLAGKKPISRTAYCWNGTNWEALDGNYNISNVYFDQDMTFTEKFGHYDVPISGYYQINSKGKSLFSVIDEAFKQTASGKKTPPTFSLTVADGSNEVGNTYSIPSATFTMTSIGSYPTYGPNDTGISVLPGNAFIKSNDYPSLSSRNETSLRKNGSISTSISGSVAYTDATSTYSYSASAEWIEGVAPKNNLGEDDPDNRILSGISSLTASASFTGYRYGFYGYRLASENRLDFSMLNSNDIRLGIHVLDTYGKRWIATSGNNWPTKFTVPKNSTQIIFAVPENAVNFNNHKYIKMSNIALGTYYFENDGLLRDPTTTGLSVDGAVSGTGKKYYVWTINPPGIFDKDAEYTIEYSSSKIQ